MSARNAVAVAREHVAEAEMFSSAKLCLADAELFLGQRDHVNARRRALDSLAYSVGVFSPAYIEAAA